MADISQIKLPNSNVYDIKDALAVSSATFSGHQLTLIKRGNTMTNIDLGEFDTLDATELNAGNLIVTGAARFTNSMYGNLSGNADTATKFSSARTITLTGDATGSASADGSSGWSIATTVGHATNADNAGTASLATTAADTSSTLYPIGVTSGATTTLKRDTSITMSGGTITATTFSGALSGNATTATTATNVSASEGTANADRHVWFSDSSSETLRAYDNDFKYNPSTNTLTVTNVAGKASSATAADSATKATQDESGNNIKATYANSISISDHTITLKNKNGASLGTVTVPDNNTWTAFVGASASSAGTAGYVSAPGVGNQNKFLRGDGTWAIPNDENTHNTAYLYAGTSSGTANAATSNGATHLILVDGGSATTRRKISGTGATTVTSNSSGDIIINSPALNTQNLTRPSSLRGTNDVTLQSLINNGRANRLAFLPANQIIIEKTTDGGTTWVDAGIADSTKLGLFSETRIGVPIPMINNVRDTNCGIRITITAMKYNVPEGTPETQKYNYWNSNYVNSTERYCTIKDMYFWVLTAYDGISVKVERATGAAPTNWVTCFNDTTYYMTGWSGSDYISFTQANFGGGTNQTTNYWNYRLTFMTVPQGTASLSPNSTSSQQGVYEIRAYGESCWSYGNSYMFRDHMYSFDANQNVAFPANVTATNFLGTATKATQDESGNNIKATYANSFSISGNVITLKNKNGASLGTVTVPNDNTWIAFVGASASSNGTAGYISAPGAGNQNKFFRGDGQWADVVITNNITGSGTSGYLAKFNGANTITNGPQLGSATNTYLRNDGTWATPPNDNTTYDAATATPIMDGTATVGTSAKYAREDHVHPHDSTKVDVVAGKGLSTEDYTTAEKTKLSGIAEGAEVNQSAFSNVVVGSTTIAADAKTDTLTLTAGSNITLTPDATNDSITIASSYTNTIPSAYCTTGANVAAKVASCTGYVLRQHNYIQVIITNSNTAASALTLAINNTTAKPIYINNVVSSSSNYTLSAGTYIVYYDGTNYQFRTDARIPGFVNSAYNCYTSSYTDSSELYATGILKAQDSSSYKRVYHSPYIIMSPYALKVKDHSNNITYGVKIDSYDTTSFTSNNVTTYTDGGRIIVYNNTYTSESSTPSSNSGVILSGQSNSIIIKQPGTTNTVMQLEGDVGRIRMYRPGYNQNTISLDSRLGSGNPSITISNPADQEYITVLKSDGLITKTHSDNETVKLYTTYTFEVDDDPNSDYFGQYSFGKLEIRNENKVYNNNNTTITTAAMITLDGETGNITAGNFTYKDNNSFTQSAIDALYPSSASSSIDIPASLVATVNSRLDTQDGIIGGLSTSVSALSDTIGIVPSNTTVQGQINTANANITTLTNTLNTMSVNLAHQTLASGSYKASTTNYEYTGVYFTLPSESTYLIRAAAAYSNGAPIGVALCNSSTTCSASTVIYVHETTTALPCGSTPVYLMIAGTYYLWVKRATVPTGANNHYIYGVRLR